MFNANSIGSLDAEELEARLHGNVKMSAVDGQPDAGRRAGRALRVAAAARRGAKAVLRHTAASGFAAAARAVLSLLSALYSLI